MNGFLLLALVGYLVASVAMHLHVFTGSERARAAAPAVTIVAAALHAVGIVLQAVEERLCPFVAAGPTIGFAGWLLAVGQIALARRRQWAAAGAVLLPLAFVALFYAGVTPRSDTPAKAIMRDPRFSLHVLPAILGFCFLALAFGAAVLYLAEQGLLKRKRAALLFARMPPLAPLGSAAHRLAVVGFSLLTLALGSGVLWALSRPEWHGWYLEPKTLTTLIAWFVYAVYLAYNHLAGWRGRRSCYLLIAGFTMVLVAYFGVRHFWSRMPGF